MWRLRQRSSKYTESAQTVLLHERLLQSLLGLVDDVAFTITLLRRQGAICVHQPNIVIEAVPWRYEHERVALTLFHDGIADA